MSYLMQSRLARDPHIIDRVTACAASERIPNPQDWAFAHTWQLSAEPGWTAAYATAQASYESWVPEEDTPQPPSPGANEAAITDGMILAAVQTLKDPAL